VSPGFHSNIPADVYHADPAPRPSLSSSLAQVLLRESPRKAWFSHPRLNKDYREQYSSTFDLGTCAHSVLLENDASRIVIVEADDWRTKAAKEQRGQARAEGKTALLSRHYDNVRLMVDAALAFIEETEIADAWHTAESEVTGIALEPSGVWLRCRFDKLAKAQGGIFDYKSTEDASPEAFSRQIVRMGYHIQEAFYRRVARDLMVMAPDFIFLAQSVEPPHECTVHRCDPALQEIADAKVEEAIATWRHAITKNEWPSYGGEINIVVPPAYMIAEHEGRLLEGAGIGYREAAA
jgi:hypothetical protein